jgi:hypothetical protein
MSSSAGAKCGPERRRKCGAVAKSGAERRRKYGAGAKCGAERRRKCGAGAKCGAERRRKCGAVAKCGGAAAQVRRGAAAKAPSAGVALSSGPQASVDVDVNIAVTQC